MFTVCIYLLSGKEHRSLKICAFTFCHLGLGVKNSVFICMHISLIESFDLRLILVPTQVSFSNLSMKTLTLP